MPLTKFQLQLVRLLAINRGADSHLAGGAALHFTPNSIRYSNDLDYFHDSVEKVASAFESDQSLLANSKYSVEVEMKQPGYIRASVSKGANATKIEWAHDSAWRFMPIVNNPDSGYQLHPIDLAINKVLALAGRDEARDYLDVIFIDKEILSLGPLCWAAVGKDPGFSPASLLELLKRRGKYRPEDFAGLMLVAPADPKQLKTQWLEMLTYAEHFIAQQPPDQIGCLYYSMRERKFVDPLKTSQNNGNDIAIHYGQAGGILPRFC